MVTDLTRPELKVAIEPDYVIKPYRAFESKVDATLALEDNQYEKGTTQHLVLAAERAREELLRKQGKREEEIYAVHEAAALARPMAHDEGLGEYPSKELLILSDYAVRYPKYRTNVIAAVVNCLTGRVHSGANGITLSLSEVVQLNRWVPIYISADEIVHSLEVIRDGPENGGQTQHIHLLLAELYRYKAALSYSLASRGNNNKGPCSSLLLSVWCQNDKGSIFVEVQGYPPRSSAKMTVFQVASKWLKKIVDD